MDGLTHQGRALQILMVYGLGLPPARWPAGIPSYPDAKDPMRSPFAPTCRRLPLNGRRLPPPGRCGRASTCPTSCCLGRTADGGPAGVSPSMAAAIAETLGLEIDYVPYPNPGGWRMMPARPLGYRLIGAEPQRAEFIGFTRAYAEIEATYLVRPGRRSKPRRCRSAGHPDRRGGSKRLWPLARPEYSSRQPDLVSGSAGGCQPGPVPRGEWMCWPGSWPGC